MTPRHSIERIFHSRLRHPWPAPSDGGSLAKTFTAAGIWWLVQEGRIKLDAPVTQYVSEYPHAHTTVRHLLSHSNGLPGYYEFFDPYFEKDEVRTTQALLRVVAKQAPAPSFPPGTRLEYSNLGFDAAALVIESVTGQSYETFLKERFFSRLGMSNTFARSARLADWKGVRTLGYRWRDAARQPFDVFDIGSVPRCLQPVFLRVGSWALGARQCRGNCPSPHRSSIFAAGLSARSLSPVAHRRW